MTTNLSLFDWLFPQVAMKWRRSPISFIEIWSSITPHQLKMLFLIRVANGQSTRTWSTHSGLLMHELHNDELTRIPLFSKAKVDRIRSCATLQIKHNTLIETALLHAIIEVPGMLTCNLSIICLRDLTENMSSADSLQLQWFAHNPKRMPDTSLVRARTSYSSPRTVGLDFQLQSWFKPTILSDTVHLFLASNSNK